MAEQNHLPLQNTEKGVAAPSQRGGAYIKVTNASVWLILISLVILMATFLYWGVEGNLPTTVITYGYVDEDGRVNCFVESNTEKQSPRRIDEGMKVELTGKDRSVSGIVSFVDTIPLSRDELLSGVKYDFFSANMTVYDWNTRLIIEQTENLLPKDSICRVKITIEEKRPIEFLLQS